MVLVIESGGGPVRIRLPFRIRYPVVVIYIAHLLLCVRHSILATTKNRLLRDDLKGPLLEWRGDRLKG